MQYNHQIPFRQNSSLSQKTRYGKTPRQQQEPYNKQTPQLQTPPLQRLQHPPLQKQEHLQNHQ